MWPIASPLNAQCKAVGGTVQRGNLRVQRHSGICCAKRRDGSERTNPTTSSINKDLRELAALVSANASEKPDEGKPSGTSSDFFSGKNEYLGEMDEEGVEDFEKAFLVGVERKRDYVERRYGYGIQESLKELESLVKTAGLKVVGKTHQSLEPPSPATYIGQGKVREVSETANSLEVDTVVFDQELSPIQLKNLDESLGEDTRVCDRTALTLDIFSQRAMTKEGKLQVELAQVEYQLPRLTRMWNHLERQAGGTGSQGAVKGMGEKQIEVDKRILRKRVVTIKRELEEVRNQRKQARERRAENDMPVIALAGYTNAGKSTLLNRLTNSEVLVEDKLFATLDPTTRRLGLPSGKEALVTDTVGFIQKLPTQLVAAFRATLEEMQDASLILHVVDVSHANAAAQADAVIQVLKDIGVEDIPILTVWNKLDQCEDPDAVREMVMQRSDTVCISAGTGEGVDELLKTIETAVEDSMIPVNICIPYSCGDLVDSVHKHGVVKNLSYTEDGAVIEASVPIYLTGKLKKYKIKGGMT
ncbi:hypothetical protein BSKO_09203 [Bryopsis sp. KO-2023]|nr:hypothetical protein BSKO_09203 [Bryopsis sp. KO-2023]